MTLPLARIKKIMKFDEDVKVWPLQPPSILHGWACVVMCTHNNRLPLPFVATLTDDQCRGPCAVC
jgi:hypothetical protein